MQKTAARNQNQVLLSRKIPTIETWYWKTNFLYLRVALLNCRVLSSISRKERLVLFMTKQKLDILCLQETTISSNAKECHNNYVMFWSSGVKDDDRDKAINFKRPGKASRDGGSHN